MAAMRINIPTIFVSGGPMKAGVDETGQKKLILYLFLRVLVSTMLDK